ncbi:MAG: hypothetical protein P8J20_02185 [Novosphingobium sp.]|nr:hypothetical protein [Novosphingobium sp.]
MDGGHPSTRALNASGQSNLACSKDEAPTAIYLTIDTEYESGFTAKHGLDSREANFRRSILGETEDGAVGIAYQLDKFDRHGLKAVFFVDPMPALLWGVEAVSDVVGPIISRGHDVQLHLHTEWLALAGAANPLGERVGDNLKQFSLEEQCALIEYARKMLIAAGAPPPVAFRAGNYGANDDTLRALAEFGITHDTSFSPGFDDCACDISLGPDCHAPIRHCGVVEVPVGCIADGVNRTRHAQLTALSKHELLAAIRHARDSEISSFTIVSHSFELLSRDRSEINRILKRRFDRFCAALGRTRNVETAAYSESPPSVASGSAEAEMLPPNKVRTSLRMAEQSVSNLLYEGKKSAAVATGLVAAAATAAVAID